VAIRFLVRGPNIDVIHLCASKNVPWSKGRASGLGQGAKPPEAKHF